MIAKQKPVNVPFNPKDASTDVLIAGLYCGYNLTYYDFEAVTELLARGEKPAVMEAQAKTKRRWASWAIKKALNT